MKKILFSVVVMVSFLCSTNINVNNGTVDLDRVLNALADNHVEVTNPQKDKEPVAGDYHSGSTMGIVNRQTSLTCGCSAGVSQNGVCLGCSASVTYTSLSCCVSSSSMDACDYDRQSKDC